MFIKDPPADSDNTSLGEQLSSAQPTIPQEPQSIAPAPAGDQIDSAIAESLQSAETTALRSAETEPGRLPEVEVPLPTKTASEGLVVVGKGANIVGEISNCSQVEIEGALDGNVVAEAVIIRPGGQLKGRVHSQRAEVHGTIEGQVQVEELLDIRSTGQVSGELAYGKLSVASGGRLAGDIQLFSDLHNQQSEAEPLDSNSIANGFMTQTTT